MATAQVFGSSWVLLVALKGYVIGMEPTFLLASRCPVRVGDDVPVGLDILCSMRSRRQKESFPLPLFMSEVTPAGRPPDQASARRTMPANTSMAAPSRALTDPSPNQNSPIIAAKITDVSRSAETMPIGAFVLA